MEKETDILHLLGQHQVLLFITSGLLLVLLMVLIGSWVIRRAERKQRENDGTKANRSNVGE